MKEGFDKNYPLLIFNELDGWMFFALDRETLCGPYVEKEVAIASYLLMYDKPRTRNHP